MAARWALQDPQPGHYRKQQLTPWLIPLELMRLRGGSCRLSASRYPLSQTHISSKRRIERSYRRYDSLPAAMTCCLTRAERRMTTPAGKVMSSVVGSAGSSPSCEVSAAHPVTCRPVSVAYARALQSSSTTHAWRSRAKAILATSGACPSVARKISGLCQRRPTAGNEMNAPHEPTPVLVLRSRSA